MNKAAIYARVSTSDQDVERQLEEAKDFLNQQLDVTEIVEFPEIVSGATADRRSVYDELFDRIGDGDFDVVVVHEISRISRLGGSEVYRFIQHCLENETAVESLDIGLSIRVDDPSLQQTLYTMIANIMGDLAKIEHQQKLERINSGIRSAQNQGKWVGRPPKGFKIGDDGLLHIKAEEFLEVRQALVRVENGESRNKVARETGIPLSTLSRLYGTRKHLYLEAAEQSDSRIESALDEIRPLDKLDRGEAGALDAKIRSVVNEEIEKQKEGN